MFLNRLIQDVGSAAVSVAKFPWRLLNAPADFILDEDDEDGNGDGDEHEDEEEN